ncbi:MAG: ABC transporter permease subunit [Anaerolineales bacterium]|nr:ABC transporter permease subunit [Anaerolineales bacterium]
MQSEYSPAQASSPGKTATPESAGSFGRLVRYARRRLLMIALTILAGVYLTVMIANHDGELDRRVERQVGLEIRSLITDQVSFVESEQVRLLLDVLSEEWGRQAGLEWPKALRNLRWTFKSLVFDWGPADFPSVMFVPSSWDIGAPVAELVLEALPNTLLLIGTADLLIFIIGIPLALAIASRRSESRLDRLLAMLSPLSSVPSWIHGILLVAIFAAGFGILPFSGKYDNIPPDTQWGYILVVGKHMILPVLAILFGMFFQLVYIWRTFFRIYSQEDYIDLAIAKGLPARLVERNYILRPTLPTILTSFALTLAGFWQTTTALEYFFNWPGLGQMYVKALPNYLGENFYRGEMGIVISIVVIFAYLLGLIVFLLDLAYAWLDPRVRVGTEDQSLRLAMRSGRQLLESWLRHTWRRLRGQETAARPARLPQPGGQRQRDARSLDRKVRDFFSGCGDLFLLVRSSLGSSLREIRRYPSAILGLAIISLMIASSIYTVVAMPYTEIGEDYYQGSVTGRYYRPRNAPPEWTNWFRSEKLPTTQVLRSQDGTILKTRDDLSENTHEVVFKISFDYQAATWPEDVLIYFYPTYQEKRPFISVRWLTPDGREIQLKDGSVESGATYFFSDYVNVSRALFQHPTLREWVVVDGFNPTPPYQLLFTDPESGSPVIVPGTYQVEVAALFFEPEGDMEMEFVLLGEVHGLAGSDFNRRDLLVPLLWGMPFALGFGILGAFVTTVLAMIISAAGVWQGGWLDNLVERLTEVNMILPVLAIGILIFALYGVNLFLILGAVVLLNVFSTPTKTFRAAFLQIKEAPYIEAARTYGASNTRIVFNYLIPRILPTVIPQLVVLIPSFVFLEATLAIFNVFDPRYPTWGKVIYEALSSGAWWGGSRFWVLEPISLLLLAGLAFALLGFALERILNPRLLER